MSMRSHFEVGTLKIISSRLPESEGVKEIQRNCNIYSSHTTLSGRYAPRKYTQTNGVAVVWSPVYTSRIIEIQNVIGRINCLY
jgi:hypothetical protein